MQYDMSRTTLFEVSWEVCNKVGGIYAVVSSKALEAAALFGDNYYLLGPDLGNNAEFEETDEACWQELRAITARRNLACRFGRWDIPGRPKVILVGYRDRFNQGQLLFSLWNRYGIDSISGGWDYVEPVMFSTACGEVIEAACQTLAVPASGPVLAHFHEWMCGGGLLYLKERAPKLGTVFTTHATMLGRSMAGCKDVDGQAKRRAAHRPRRGRAHGAQAQRRSGGEGLAQAGSRRVLQEIRLPLPAARQYAGGSDEADGTMNDRPLDPAYRKISYDPCKPPLLIFE